MADKPGWVPPGVDTKRANIARVYDYWLGGSHNFLADQDLGRALAAVDPNVRAIARANRAFLGRAVRFLSAAGIRQFLDVGSGIPTQRNVHEVAQQADPGTRVVYADIDPVVIAHSKAILAGNHDAAVIDADLRDPEKVLSHSATQQLIDFTQPVGLLLVAVVHFIADADDPGRSLAILRERLASGSYLVLTHATNESRPVVTQAAEKVYQGSVPSAGRTRSRAEIVRFFEGFDLEEPGLVYLPQWHPDSPGDVPRDPSQFWFLAGVARKP
jgi:SAM-dependent methyltransferase